MNGWSTQHLYYSSTNWMFLERKLNTQTSLLIFQSLKVIINYFYVLSFTMKMKIDKKLTNKNTINSDSKTFVNTNSRTSVNSNSRASFNGEVDSRKRSESPPGKTNIYQDLQKKAETQLQ